ncbi:hypothetical protein D3C80_1228640 [compost metagenome]
MEKTPGVGQLQRAAALQQHHPQFVLQLLDLPAQRRLGDVQALGGAGEVEGLSQYLEITQVPQFHGASGFSIEYL